MRIASHFTSSVVLGALTVIAACGKASRQESLPNESSAKAETAGSTSKGASGSREVDVRVKVGVLMKNGDVKPVARRDFALSKLSLAALYEEELAAKPVPTVEKFCKSQGYGAEFLALLAGAKWDVEEFRSTLALLPREQIRAIPELEEAWRKAYNSFNDPDNADSRRVRLSFVDSVVDKLHGYVHAIADAKGAALVRAQARLLATKPVMAKSSLTGELAFREIPAGDYFVSNVDYAEIGERSVLWDLAVKVGQGENYFELSNDNAWRIH